MNAAKPKPIRIGMTIGRTSQSATVTIPDTMGDRYAHLGSACRRDLGAVAAPSPGNGCLEFHSENDGGSLCRLMSAGSRRRVARRAVDQWLKAGQYSAARLAHFEVRETGATE